jgi:hypothetical protein
LKPKLLLLKLPNIFRFAGSKTAGLKSPAVFVCGSGHEMKSATTVGV